MTAIARERKLKEESEITIEKKKVIVITGTAVLAVAINSAYFVFKSFKSRGKSKGFPFSDGLFTCSSFVRFYVDIWC